MYTVGGWLLNGVKAVLYKDAKPCVNYEVSESFIMHGSVTRMHIVTKVIQCVNGVSYRK